VLHTVWNIRGEELSVGIGQEVVNCITFWNRTIVYKSVNIIVGRTNTQLGLEQTSSHELSVKVERSISWA